MTCWLDWHNRLPLSMPTVELGGPPEWLQVVHGTNVNNRVKGLRVAPGPHVERFADGVAGIEDPSRPALAKDRLVDVPRRLGVAAVRRVVKAMILAGGGKAGLDRAKGVAAAVGQRARSVR
jgi:hypothetical protein